MTEFGVVRVLLLLSSVAAATAACNMTGVQQCIFKPAVNLLFYCHVPLSNSSALQLQSDTAPLFGSSAQNASAMGAARVFDYKCTATPDASAQAYCRARGAAFVDSRNNTQIMVSSVALAANSSHRGSMSVAGEILSGGNFSTSAAVVGGVGDFLAAAGEISISTYNGNVSGNAHMILKFVAMVVFPLYTV